MDDKDLIAYFSMEIGLQESIPTYAGGLGILAGDTLKSFADIGMDAVAVTLLSEKGYFYQKLDDSGYQHEEPNVWPIKDFLDKLDVVVEINIDGRNVKVGVWEHFITGVSGKRVRVLYLDTNIDGNSDDDKSLTSYLYGGDLDYRLKQEVVLGIGGVRVLRDLGYRPKKFHMNEGHAAFLCLELFREFSDLSLIRNLCSFTTHTPVSAGHDSFDMSRVRACVGDLLSDGVVAKMGDKFSMTELALMFSSYTNAVSRKHRDVSKGMFPNHNIDYITNGIHSCSWVNSFMAEVFDKHVSDWRSNPLDLRNVIGVSVEEIGSAHQKAKDDLIRHVNNEHEANFDSSLFTVGFARRATGYKRVDLLLRDFDRLKSFASKFGGLQIVFSGKAHPRDEQGKRIIQKIVRSAEVSDGNLKIVFLDNYNIHVAKLMVSGCDLWLNTPKRPLEASGTSGMKAAVNGVPSLSVPDGWWIEGGLEGITGWDIGREFSNAQSDEERDDEDFESLMRKLEHIMDLFFNHKEKFLHVMRNSIAINGSYFNTHRMAKQYLVRAYARNQDV